MFQDGSDQKAGRSRVPKPRPTTERWQASWRAARLSQATECSERRTVLKPTDSLASNDFAYCLTLSPKCFSSFPHGTCSLSVSRQYLALDEIYHPFSAGVPTNATLRTLVVRGELSVKDGILTLYDTLFQRDLYRGRTLTKRL